MAKNATKARAPAAEDREPTGRALWKGSVSFGLIDIPVALKTAEQREELRFNMLDKRDMSPIRYERVNAKTGKPVPWDDVVKGYEYDDGNFVVVSEKELKAANPEATQTVDILSFVDADEIETEYFERPYFLEPGKRGRKGYALLREVLERSKRVAIAKVVIRTRQHLAAVIPREDVLVLELLRWPHELRDTKSVHVPSGALKDLGITTKELEMAGKLVEGMVEEWKPEEYRDTYRDDVLALVERKVKSGKLTAVEEPESEPAAPRGAEVVDFMSLLKKSLDEKVKAGARSAAARKKPARGAGGGGRKTARSA